MFEEAADLTIAAAVHGLSDSRGFLADIDPNALTYINLKHHNLANQLITIILNFADW